MGWCGEGSSGAEELCEVCVLGCDAVLDEGPEAEEEEGEGEEEGEKIGKEEVERLREGIDVVESERGGVGGGGPEGIGEGGAESYVLEERVECALCDDEGGVCGGVGGVVCESCIQRSAGDDCAVESWGGVSLSLG